MNTLNKEQLRFDITCIYKENGKNLMDILKSHFFIYLKQLQKDKKI